MNPDEFFLALRTIIERDEIQASESCKFEFFPIAILFPDGVSVEEEDVKAVFITPWAGEARWIIEMLEQYFFKSLSPEEKMNFFVLYAVKLIEVLESRDKGWYGEKKIVLHAVVDSFAIVLSTSCKVYI